MNPVQRTVRIGDQEVTFETGKIAKQASGSVTIKAGGTLVLVTAQAAKDPKPGIDFMPLTVDYQEKMSAAGKIPGGFFKREGKPRDDETLTSRLIDRSLRPLFPEGWGCETQVIASTSEAFSRSVEITTAAIWVSLRQPFLNSGRLGRSIRREVSVSFSEGRPSRLKKPPGILPAA